MVDKILKLLLISLVNEAVDCVGNAQLNAMTFKAMNKIQCYFSDVLDKVDKVSYDTWTFGDENRKFPETEKATIELFDSFWSTLTDNNVVTSLSNKYFIKFGQGNLIEKFLGKFNKSSFMEILKERMPSVLEQQKICNQNDQKFSPIVKNYRNVLMYAGSLNTDLTLSKFACYVKKYFQEFDVYIIESIYPLRELIFSPYLTVANALGADSNCEWHEVPEVPNEMCFRSTDVLFIRAISNLFRIKYLNYFTSVNIN